VTDSKTKPATPAAELRKRAADAAAARQRARDRAGDDELPRKSGAPKRPT
jgi:hypothetical protein